MKIKKICKQCGKEFEVPKWYKHAKYCSRKCADLSHTADIKEFICAKCGKRFYDKEYRRLRYNCSLAYCSKKCFLERDFIRKEYHKTVCNFCGKELWRWRFELKRSHSFCDSRCQMNYYRKILKKKIIPPPLSWNHPNVIATRFKKGEQRGKKHWFIKGFIPWNKGIKRPEITGINNPCYGIHFDHTKEAKNKIKKASLKMWEKISIEERSERFLKQWENMSNESLFKYFKSKMFGKDYKPNELDKKAIKSNILIHKIRRSLNVNK